MKKILISLVLSLTLLTVNAANYEVDSSHTNVIFKINHLGIADTYGAFMETTGNFNLEDNKFEFTIKVDKINTFNEKRDQHLKSPDFFNAKQFPVIKFKGSKVKALGGDRYEVTGNLLLHGVKKKLTVEVVKTGEGKDPWGGYRQGLHANFTIKRSDFGMKYMLEGIGDEVEIFFSSEGLKKK